MPFNVTKRLLRSAAVRFARTDARAAAPSGASSAGGCPCFCWRLPVLLLPHGRRERQPDRDRLLASWHTAPGRQHSRPRKSSGTRMSSRRFGMNARHGLQSPAPRR